MQRASVSHINRLWRGIRSALCWLSLCCVCLQALRALAQERASEASPEPVQGAPRAGEAALPSSRSKALRWAGIGLGAIGTGALATGWGFGLRAEALRSRLHLLDPQDPRHSSTRASLDRAHKLSFLGVGGGALSIGALQLALPKAEGVPAWTYALGAVGVGLIGLGSYELFSNSHCTSSEDDASCQGTKRASERGGLLLATGVPLLTIPLTYLLRKLIPNERASLSLKPAMATGGAAIRLQGKF